MKFFAFLFVISSIYFMMRQHAKPMALNMVGSALCYFFALLSKENAMTALAVFPLILYYFTSADLKKTIGSTAIFGVVAIVYLGIRYMALKGLNYDVEILAINNSLVDAPNYASRLAGAIMVMGRYLLLLFIPHPLVFDYSYNQIPNVGFSDFKTLLSLAVYLSLFVFTLKSLKSKNPIGFGFLFF